MVPEGFFDIPNCSIIRETPRKYGAYIVEQEDLGEVSIPKSVVHADSELPHAPAHGIMMVAEWFVEVKKWDRKL